MWVGGFQNKIAFRIFLDHNKLDQNKFTIAATKTTSGDFGVVNRVGRQDCRDGPHFLVQQTACSSIDSNSPVSNNFSRTQTNFMNYFREIWAGKRKKDSKGN